MKAAALAASGLLLMAPCERPPVQYQGESVPAVILFAEPGLVDAVCREAASLKGAPGRILACTNPNTSVMLLPDPCLYADGYAELLCHERAHLKRPDGSIGWVHG
jgi:hypothetical protein